MVGLILAASGCGSPLNGLFADATIPAVSQLSHVGSSSNRYDAGVLFANESSYLCLPLEKLGINPAQEIVSIKSSCECVRPSVVRFLQRRSQEIAERAGARVVSISQRGYGAALLGGIAAARGKYIVMGDADCSYDFGEVPRFIAKLEEGFDLVMGNRIAGEIKPGAMPWHHRYVGNPLLSGIGRLLYCPGCRDFHCGLRAFDREKVIALRLVCPGMEFATEMVIRATKTKFRTSEIPVTLYPDHRNGPSHLRSFRDGCRHLRVLCRL